jgi:hypothetical protein
MTHLPLAPRRLAKSLTLGLAAFSLVSVANAQSFYKERQLFSTAPNEAATVNAISNFGPVGIAIELHQPAFTMKVGDLDPKNPDRAAVPGSPADLTGAFKAGQIIESINGETLKDIDPRIQLGQMIEKAEATDGVLKPPFPLPRPAPQCILRLG